MWSGAKNALRAYAGREIRRKTGDVTRRGGLTTSPSPNVCYAQGRRTLDQRRFEPCRFQPEGECWSADACTRDQYSFTVHIETANTWGYRTRALPAMSALSSQCLAHGTHHHRVGQVSPLLGPRATRLCQAKANSASSSAPMPTGTTRKLHDMLLATTTNGSIPAGG